MRYRALELTDTSKTLSEYSTGMRKRVAFAAAVIHTPDILFLDEPFESIDPAGVALMKQWLRRFTGHESTLLRVGVSPDGRRGWSTDMKNALRFWDLPVTGDVPAPKTTPDKTKPGR